MASLFFGNPFGEALLEAFAVYGEADRAGPRSEDQGSKARSWFKSLTPAERQVVLLSCLVY